MAEYEESACCGIVPQAGKTKDADAAAYCMRPDQQVVRSHMPGGPGGPLWAGGNAVGNYTNAERPIEEDTLFHTPFEGALIREDGTAGIVTKDSDFTGKVRADEKSLPVEAGRYRLLWTPLCPWATRVKITLGLLGIGEDVISTGKADPVKTKNGWSFAGAPDGKDPVLGIRYLDELYRETAQGEDFRATVPALADVKERKVANNDYHRLPLYLETVWRPFHRENAPDLYPERYRCQIDRLERILFNDVGNRVYQAGYAKTQEEYEHSYYIFFTRLNYLDRYLGKHRYLMGDQLTDADIRLYAALVRLDAAYYFEFRLNGMHLYDYENLWRYTRELYDIPAFKEATDFDAIKKGYYLGPGARNPFRIVPEGPDERIWQGRGREALQEQAKEEHREGEEHREEEA